LQFPAPSSSRESLFFKSATVFLNQVLDFPIPGVALLASLLLVLAISAFRTFATFDMVFTPFVLRFSQSKKILAFCKPGAQNNSLDCRDTGGIPSVTKLLAEGHRRHERFFA